MKVATAISLLQELDPEAQICAQWYDQDDMSRSGVDGEYEKVPDEVWKLAIDIFNRYEFPDMMYLVEEAIREAEKRLSKEKE